MLGISAQIEEEPVVTREAPERAPLTPEQQERRRAFFRNHWTEGVAFNVTLGVSVLRWDPEAVELEIPYSDAMSAHEGIFHGGVLSALIDTAGAGAVMAGHDFNLGSRLSTISLSVNYLSAARGNKAVASARCTRRGRTTHYASVDVRTDDGKLVAHGIGAYLIAGERRGIPD
jgi:uncharacterized protein (TIGR00369 family)